MGRIALFDGHARKYVGDDAALATFDDHILGCATLIGFAMRVRMNYL